MNIILKDSIIQYIEKNCNIEYILQCIQNPQIRGFDKEDIKHLTEYTIFNSNIVQVINFLHKNQTDNTKKIKEINLPKDMTIGIEIESEGDASTPMLVDCCFVEKLKGWEVKNEGSIHNGLEITSPIIKKQDKREKQIYDICSVLKLFGNHSSERCGGHVHIGADYLKNINAWKNLVEIWTNTENIMYIISNEQNQAPRNGINVYAAPIAQNIEKVIEKGEVNFENENEINEFRRKISLMQGNGKYSSRFSGINFQNFDEKDKNTIEFRLANGTINPDIWIENINLFGGIIAASQEIADIQKKAEKGKKLTPKEEKKLMEFENLKEPESNEISEEDKLYSLLSLVIDEKDRQIYIDRYNANKNLVPEKIVNIKKPISISKKKLGKMAFTGKNGINGIDYQNGETLIQSELEEYKSKDISKLD